jgi:hypothetical protein
MWWEILLKQILRGSIHQLPVAGHKKLKELERETGFEPATSTLARLHSTAELFPQPGEILCRREEIVKPVFLIPAK